MKKLLLVFCIAVSMLSYSQKKLSAEYSYKVSQPYKVFDAANKFYFAKDNQAMTVKIHKDEVLIQKFNTDKPLFINEKLYEKKFPKNFVVEDILEINNKFYFFYSSWDGDNEKEQLFYNEIDFEKGEFVDTPKMLFDVKGKVTGTSMGYSVQDKFPFLLSHDKKNILIKYRKKPEVKRDVNSYDIIGLMAFDENLIKTSGNELKMPYTERRMDNLDYHLDNNGNLYLLTKVFHDDSNKDKKKKKDEEANYHLELFFVKAGTSKIDITRFENKEKFINKLWIFDTPNDFLVCGGFYSNGKGERNDSDGIMSFKINNTGGIYDEVYHDIPLELLNMFESKKTVKKNEKKEEKGEEAKFKDLKLKNLNVDKDGNVVLIGEQDFVIAYTNSKGNTYYKYFYQDIFAAKINKNGGLDWMKKVPKNQYGSRGKSGMSYKYFFANNNHYLVFLDNVKNIEIAVDKAPERHTDGQGGYLTSVKINDNDGTLSKGSILNAREVEDFKLHQFSTNRVFKVSENAFMFEAYKKNKEDVMIKVEMN